MNRRFCFRVFLLAMALCISMGALAHAGKVTIENDTPYEISMAFKFYDYSRKEWVVWGWYKVPAGTTKSWAFKLAPDRKVYWYGKTSDGKRYWPGSGDHGQSVISKKMDGIKGLIRFLRGCARPEVSRSGPSHQSQFHFMQ